MGWNLLKRLGLTALTLVQNVYLVDRAVRKTKIPVAHCRSCGWVFFRKKLEHKTKRWYLLLLPILTKLELVLFLLIARLYYLGRKSEVRLSINHPVNKTKDAAASWPYKCSSLFTGRIVLHAFSSPTIKTSHNHGENLCMCKPVHVWVRNSVIGERTALLSQWFSCLWACYCGLLFPFFLLHQLLWAFPAVCNLSGLFSWESI